MKTYLAISISLLIFLCFGCFNGKKKKCSANNIQSMISYEITSKVLDTISSRYKEGYIEFPFTLHEDRKFEDIINNPCEYKTSLLAAIKDDNKGNVYKLVALYGLQHLCIDDYIEVLNTVFVEFKQKKVDESFLMSSIDQDEFSLEVCKNYRNGNLQQTLENILPALTKETNRKLVKDMISGDIWNKLHEYFRDSGEHAPWTCD